MKIKDVRKLERLNDRSISVRRDVNGVPYALIVWYSSGTNQMSLPYEVGRYFLSPRGWEEEKK